MPSPCFTLVHSHIPFLWRNPIMFTVNSTQYPAGKAWVQYCQIATFATWRLWNNSLNQNAVSSWQQEQSMGREKGFKTKARLYTSFLPKSSLSTECLTYPSRACGGTDWSQSCESAVLVIASSVSDHFLQQSFSVRSGHHWIAGHGRALLFKCLRHPSWTSVSKFSGKAVSECNHQEE